jgi:hypothetical protein
MNILERLPDDIIRYTIEFIPNHYQLNPWSFTSIYLDKNKHLIYVIQLSLTAMIKLRRTHVVYIIKVRRYPRGIICAINFNKLKNILKLRKDKVILLSTSWYINKSYKNLVFNLCSGDGLRQHVYKAFIQMLLLGLLQSLFINSNFLKFCIKYIILFITKIIIRRVYETIIVA